MAFNDVEQWWSNPVGGHEERAAFRSATTLITCAWRQAQYNGDAPEPASGVIAPEAHALADACTVVGEATMIVTRKRPSGERGKHQWGAVAITCRATINADNNSDDDLSELVQLIAAELWPTPAELARQDRNAAERLHQARLLAGHVHAVGAPLSATADHVVQLGMRATPMATPELVATDGIDAWRGVHGRILATVEPSHRRLERLYTAVSAIATGATR